jgi:hypothetical protein
VPERIDDVCSWGQSGRNMLAARLSAFDPREDERGVRWCNAHLPRVERRAPADF